MAVKSGVVTRICFGVTEQLSNSQSATIHSATRWQQTHTL